MGQARHLRRPVLAQRPARGGRGLRAVHHAPTARSKRPCTCSGRTAAIPDTTPSDLTPALVLPAPPLLTVAVSGNVARFPVRRIICVGRNYAAHAREMGRDPDGEPPFFFLKPADAVVDDGTTLPYPPETSNFQYEIELVVALDKAGSDIPVEQALDHVFGYAVGIDLTRRDRSSRRTSRAGLGTGARASTAPLPSRRCIRCRRWGTRPRAASGSRWTGKWGRTPTAPS